VAPELRAGFGGQKRTRATGVAGCGCLSADPPFLSMGLVPPPVTVAMPPVTVAMPPVPVATPIARCIGIYWPRNYGRRVDRSRQWSCVDRNRDHVDLRCCINRGCIQLRCRVGRWRCRRCVPSAGGAGSAEPSANALAAESTKAAAPRKRTLVITNLPRTDVAPVISTRTEQVGSRYKVGSWIIAIGQRALRTDELIMNSR
jgi:hypothetical protein